MRQTKPIWPGDKDGWKTARRLVQSPLGPIVQNKPNFGERIGRARGPIMQNKAKLGRMGHLGQPHQRGRLRQTKPISAARIPIILLFYHSTIRAPCSSCETNPIARSGAPRRRRPWWPSGAPIIPVFQSLGAGRGAIMQNKPNLQWACRGQGGSIPTLPASGLLPCRSLLCTHHNNGDAGVLTERSYAVYCPAIPSGSFKERS